MNLEAPPDLNRGWKFCRFPQVLYVVDSSCSLVSGIPRFSMVFGRSWTEVGLKFSVPARPRATDPLGKESLVDCPNDLYSDHAMRLVGSA